MVSTNDIQAAQLLLARLGLRPEDLLSQSPVTNVPTFGEYIPRVESILSAGTVRTYRPYLNRIREQWRDRPLDEPTALELKEMVEQARHAAAARKNSRGGRSAAEHMVGAIRCLYRHARDDGYVPAAGNAAAHIDKPRRRPSSRTALSDGQLTQINRVVATTGNDPDLDSLIVRLHIETACRRGGALALRPRDLDETNCLIWLREKDQSDRWQPVSPTLMKALVSHGNRSADPAGQLLCYRNGRPVTGRRYDYLWDRVGREIPWVKIQQVTAHWLRHTTLTWVERNFGYATARAFAGHAEPSGADGPTLTYVRASLPEVAAALAALVGEPHPLAPGENH
ncbi:integrase [Nocardia sp. 852002-20019_SCH5090214]|uniref:tyrosine-type recombinase/integrase n=1 Tax=Nocardia TaxID=1817 RepID=UPI0007A41439|nr:MULTISPECIES: site-specific integrase [Nocardia]MCC3316714.1 site-specific integrase [Nocardia africana]OBA50922.1 integrase [Nocardia sp. 852002-20019_SCH5090214]